jgi:hypothetical protein
LLLDACCLCHERLSLGLKPQVSSSLVLPTKRQSKTQKFQDEQ